MSLKYEKPRIDEYGTQKYYNSDGQLHRDNDQPAIIWVDGTKLWYKNGQKHREDGPAVIYKKSKEYWLNGNLLTAKEFRERKKQKENAIQKDFNKITQLVNS